MYILNSKNINQWLKKSILVSVYVYTLNNKNQWLRKNDKIVGI
jgi:uncharacterized protein (DUF608 family)